MYKFLKSSVKSNLNEQRAHQLRKLRSLGYQAIDDLRQTWLSNVFPAKPTTLNLLVNDVCNSRCQMCLIWKQKKDKELTPEELARVLSDDLFSELKYVGVSGGEPTLRTDIPELFEVICSKQPRIAGTGIITNGIIENTVKERVLAAAEVCKAHSVPFNVMISLDGLGEVHDLVRGRKNNFESAISLLNFFHKETDIPTSFGCTITKTNALYVDELLDYAQAEGLYGRFRIAEFIERLYNNGQTEFIRAFDDKTLYHLGLFFFRIEREFEHNPMYRKTYKNIRAMLAEDKPRQMGCPYQAKAAVLTSCGDLLYCAPKSPILGNTLQISASKIYFSHLSKREEIKKKDCSTCIHDYHVPVTVQEKLFITIENRRRHKYSCTQLLQISSQVVKEKKRVTELSSLKSKKVLIIGWYGTETVGDKAILWTVVERLRTRPNPPEKIYLSSLYPFISQWTVKEMNLGTMTIVETYSKEFERVCHEVDEIVVGGGPLMDIEPLNHILYAFIQAAKRKSFTRIEGCGIGPLVSPLYSQVVSEILRLSDCVTLRDLASANRCSKDFSMTDVSVVSDPATDYVQFVKTNIDTWKAAVPPLGKANNVSCFLRDWTEEYIGDFNKADFNSIKHEFEGQLTQLVLSISKVKKLDIHLLPMHTFYVGGDDRVFNRRFYKSLSHAALEQKLEPSIHFARCPVSPFEILQSMHYAKLNICMRFHSVLFAETLGVPYLAIDYTGGGKIKAFLESKGKLDQLLSLQEMLAGQWQVKLEALYGFAAKI